MMICNGQKEYAEDLKTGTPSVLNYWNGLKENHLLPAPGTMIHRRCH